MDDFPPARAPIEIEWPPRVERAERPRRRFDWRSLVGGTGRIFISVGVLLFGFVAYQLWGTGIQQARSQDKLQNQFEDVLSQGGTATTVATSPGTTAAPSTSGTGSAAGTTSPTVLDNSITASSAPRAIGPVDEGDPIARMIIPEIGVDQVVVSGVKLADLERGPGHYPDTPFPGELGNAAIAGHRSTFGAPFARLDELQKGDEIDVVTVTGRFVYRVVDSRIVEPTEIGVIANTPDAQLTLTTCHPKFSADKRLVIRAVLDVTAGASKPVPASSTSAPASSSASTPATTEANSATVSAAPATTAAVASPTTTAGGASASRSTDVFRQGWWSDDRAWGDVVAWGTALGLVSILAWRLSWRVRRTVEKGGHRREKPRNWVGALAGIAPFLVTLYFFYENVARLLPPNI